MDNQSSKGSATLYSATGQHIFHFLKVWLFVTFVPAMLSGCNSHTGNRVQVVDYSTSRPSATHLEDFEDAFYRVGQGGLVDVVLHKTTASEFDRTQDVTQVIHLRSFWKPVPGRTYANDTMLNANVCYAMFKGSSGIGYEGGGFMEYQEDSQHNVLKGKLEGGNLQPLRRVGGDLSIFERVGIIAYFEARRDDRRVTKIINFIDRSLGPTPQIAPAHAGPDY